MNTSDKKYYQIVLVLVGDFQPAMFQPLWMKKIGVISDKEYESIISNQKRQLIVNTSLTEYETDLLSFHIDQKRFQIMGKKEPFEVIIDAFKKIFDSLSSIPLIAYGLNYNFHIEADDKRELQRFGKRLAPWNYWDSLLDEDDNESGLISMTMRKMVDYGQINVTVESSTMVKGVYFGLNFHHSKVTGLDSFSVGDIEKEIEKQFKDHESRTSLIVDDLVNKVVRYD